MDFISSDLTTSYYRNVNELIVTLEKEFCVWYPWNEWEYMSYTLNHPFLACFKMSSVYARLFFYTYTWPKYRTRWERSISITGTREHTFHLTSSTCNFPPKAKQLVKKQERFVRNKRKKRMLNYMISILPYMAMNAGRIFSEMKGRLEAKRCGST